MKKAMNLESVIPGGAHTYSRGRDQFPATAPTTLVRGRGPNVWSSEGAKYLDMGMGLRSVILGHGNRGVSRAIMRASLNGVNLTLPTELEFEAASALLEDVPSAEMVKFARHGSSVVTAAVKVARAYTGRYKVLVCADHPFFSFDDWFIASTPMSKGTPPWAQEQVSTFKYGEISSVAEKLESGDYAAVILEPATSLGPSRLPNTFEPSRDNFLTEVRKLATQTGTVMILDEMITGYRFNVGAAHSDFSVVPDMSTFGKAMGNGHAIAALAGKRELMQLGGIYPEGAERVFLLSSTHGSEAVGLAAFLETRKQLKAGDVPAYLANVGQDLVSSANRLADEFNLGSVVRFYGHPSMPYYETRDQAGAISLEFRTLFSQELARAGVLAPYISLSQSHGKRQMRKFFVALERALSVYRLAMDRGIESYLQSQPIKPVFRAVN